MRYKIILNLCVVWFCTVQTVLLKENGSVSSEEDDIWKSISSLKYHHAHRHRSKRPAAGVLAATSTGDVQYNHQKYNHQSGYRSMSGRKKRPNIVLILTDDQDVELGSLNFMPETTHIMKKEGAEFRHAYTSTPMCCPSRSSLLTGLYVHNHNVYTNNDNCSNLHWRTEHEPRSFAAYLSSAGYHTGYFGKYLNRYNGSHIPPGWDEWGGLVMNSKYYNYSVNLNGRRIRHGNDYYKDYYPDLILNDSLTFLQQWKLSYPEKPTLLVMSFPSPHGPEDSAPQYSDMFFNVTTHHTPSYDFAPNLDKQWILQVTGKMLPIHKEFTDLLMTKRLQTLQSVDSAVKKVYEELKALQELDDTYIIYTSDHGYHLGQFGLIKGKSFPFEFDIRVPFLVRGPGIDPGIIVEEIALNIDLAPTFLDIAGLPVPVHMDGRSLLKLFHKKKKHKKLVPGWPDTFLVESSGRHDTISDHSEISVERAAVVNDESGIVYEEASNEDEEEYSTTSSTTSKASVLLDSTVPPNSASNFVSEQLRSYIQSAAEEEVENIGNGLVAEPLNPTKAERLASDCQKSEFGSPCKLGQKWYCLFEDNRWRKHKCRVHIQIGANVGSNLRKCSCITEDGIVYTRFQSTEDGPYRRHYYRNPTNGMEILPQSAVHYLYTNKTADELVNELARTWRIMRRHRRHAGTQQQLFSDRVSSIIDVIHDRIMEVKQQSYDNNTRNNSTCMVSRDGTVSCAHELYDDPTLWETSQQNIVLKIQKLQAQLHILRGIQRYLRDRRPTSKSSHDNATSHIKNNNGISEEQKLVILAELSNKTIKSVSDNEDKSVRVASHHIRHRHHAPKINSDFNNNDQMADNNIKSALDRSIHATGMEENVTLKGKRRGFHRHLRDNTQNVPIHNKSLPDTCYCVPYKMPDDELSEQEILKEQKRRIKEQRLKKKQRKSKRRAKLEKECYLEKMNCFRQDNNHWRTPPYWTDGPFCFCTNANNNTYVCLRTINVTHNFLYCEFVTGLITFYNLRIDPFQQWNRFNTLSPSEKSWLKDTLAYMVSCKGARECTVSGGVRLMDVITSAKKKYSIPDRNGGKRRNISREKYGPEQNRIAAKGNKADSALNKYIDE